MFRRNAIISVVIIILTVILGQIAKANLLVDNKILKIKTVDELNKLVFQFDLSLDDYIYPNYYTPEKALEVNDRAEIIAVVSPTGRIEQYHWLLRQEVVINKVVRGDKSLEGMTAKLDVSNGLVYYNIDEKRDPFDPRGFNLYYTNTVNIMQPGNEYLAFFNRMPLQDYAEDDIIFNCISTEYSYFNLSLPENDLLITDATANYKLEDLKEYEYFTGSKRMLDLWYDVKEAAVKKYLDPQ
ncbi:MAG TPA: hypothetical protein DEF39_10300 [Hungateiclostridium thermocellum]|jgi:hypothetical protein|uniref:Uncharacterized protein n=2 Tax=Acetivibrio thermocellus TaxID=1515 RepID=A3DHR2_ACET2|nr:hypothetical protein [Acetivibrio thermocellus]ABN53491.1 hypothetical protein Cthe_2289 [Acetivibrio thermocellus ATCC 27405]ADU75942.1 hypothetical protein Clo1313_2964 [Acetivibrio thermocellus DSM 1313]ALX09975.1 hypothetical protein AD2_02997 [Acetivibrio thermocellus AD2]ANV77749.1 hypothetical protein LQRI_3008 [Acetivibrio thermocellus DSM 2360]EIC03828.1 hypothetical protein YSBL_2469 [Acetivibrio thermocellus YS]